MFPGVTTHQFTDAVLRGSVLRTFREEIQKAQVLWKQCGFETVTTNKPFEEIVEFAGLGLAPRHEEMQQIATDSIKQGYTKRINIYAYAVQLPVSEMAKKVGDLSKAIMGSKSVAESLLQTQEHIHADVFGNAFSSTVGLHPDGQPLCSTSHALIVGGTYSNSLGNTSLTETGIESMLILARKMPNGRGLPMGGGLGVKKLVMQHDRYFDAKRILRSDRQANTANNAINALKGEADGGEMGIVANTYLPSTSNWFGITSAKNGLMSVWLEKEDMRDYGVNQNRTHVFDGYEAFGADFVNPRAVIGSSI